MLCLQLTTDAFEFLHRSLVLKILQVSLELEDVNSFIERGDALLLGFKLVDVQLATVEQHVLRLVLCSLSAFQRLEGDKSEANEVCGLIVLLPCHQVQVVDLAELPEIFSQLLLQSLHVLADRESSEVQVVPGHRPLEAQSLKSQEVLTELPLHMRSHKQFVHVLGFRLVVPRVFFFEGLLFPSSCKSWSRVEFGLFLGVHEAEERLSGICTILEADEAKAFVLLLSLGLLLESLFADNFATNYLSELSENFLSWSG